MHDVHSCINCYLKLCAPLPQTYYLSNVSISRLSLVICEMFFAIFELR